jgi:hypothetical protein
METFEIKNFGKGYDDSVNEEMADPSSTQNCLNVTYNEEYGAVSKDVGIKTLGEDSVVHPLSCTIQRVYEGNIDVSGGSGVFDDRKLIVAGGIPYTYCAGDFVIPLHSSTVFSSVSTTIPDITSYINKFFVAAGYDHDIREWDGVSPSISTNIGLGSWTTSVSLELFRAKTCDFFHNRLILANTRESENNGTTWSVHENRIRWSEQGNYNSWHTYDTAWKNAYYNDVNDRGGDEIVKLHAYKDVLLIFKKNSLWKAIWTGGDSSNAYQYIFDFSAVDQRSLGNSPWTIADTPQGVVWLNEEGLQITDGETVIPLEASKSVINLLKRLNIGSIDTACATSNDPRHEYSIAVPIDGSDYNNYLITWNWLYNTWKINDIKASAIGMWTDNVSGTWETIEDYRGFEISALKWNNYLLYPSNHYLVYGDSDGYIKRKSICYNTGAADVSYYGSAVYGTDVYGGTSEYTGYNAYHETPWLDFELPGVHKEVLRIRPLWKGTDGASVTLSYKSDLDSAWTSTTVDVFNEDGMPEQDFLFMRKTGRRFKFRIENNNANESFTLYRLIAYYNKRDWR